MNKKNMSNLQRALVEIFDSSQESIAGHANLIKKCQTLYKEVTIKINTKFYSFYFLNITQFLE